MTAVLTFWMLAAVALAGAAAVVFSRDALRLVVGLGAFLLAVAGFFVYYGMGFLAAAQVFVYVGGVLVLVLFSLLLLGRDADGRLLAPVRADFSSATVAVGLALVLGFALKDVAVVPAVSPAPDAAAALLGPLLLPAFEILGVLLLAALVATLLIVSGRGERG